MDKRLQHKPVRELLELRNQLHAELVSDEHYSQTETVAFGEHDPTDVAPVPCDDCGSLPIFVSVQDGPHTRWTVRCSRCDRKIRSTQKYPWLAMLQWRQINLGSQDYRSVPLFGLRRLDAPSARRRMNGIRRNLELRRNIALLNKHIAKRTKKSAPGRRYFQRLEAYLQWALLAQRLIKHHNRQREAARTHSEA